MYHFDYVGKRAGAVFEGVNGGMVSINNKTRFSFDDFLSTFVLIENYKHPFTITTTVKRYRKIERKLVKLGYVGVRPRHIDFNMGEENAWQFHFRQIGKSNPFNHGYPDNMGDENDRMTFIQVFCT